MYAPLVSTEKRVGMSIGRGFLDTITLGLAEIWFRAQRISHDVIYVEFKFDCRVHFI